MQYERVYPNDKTVLKFEGYDEVKAIQQAVLVHNRHLRGIGNEGSISKYHEDVVSQWKNCHEEYTGNVKLLHDALDHYIDSTESDVDALLDQEDRPKSKMDAAQRWKNGEMAFSLKFQIELEEFRVKEMADDEEEVQDNS